MELAANIREAMEVEGIRTPKERKANGWKILVVDDNDMVRKVMVEVLHLLGYEVEAVVSGEEALAAFDEARHALLITDHHMPGIRGSELIQILRQRSPSLPIIAVTAAEAEKELLTAGAREVLKKPCDIDQIRETVERGLDL